MDAHLAVRKLMLRIPLGRERVASDSLFLPGIRSELPVAGRVGYGDGKKNTALATSDFFPRSWIHVNHNMFYLRELVLNTIVDTFCDVVGIL